MPMLIKKAPTGDEISKADKVETVATVQRLPKKDSIGEANRRRLNLFGNTSKTQQNHTTHHAPTIKQPGRSSGR